jgi:hypothetical protein
MVADLRRADLTDATLVWVSVSLGRHTLAHGAGTTGAPSGHGGEPVCLPLHEEFLPNGKRLPTGEHGIEGWPDRGRGARPPGSDMGVCDMFGGVERFPVRPNELLSWLRAAALNDTLEEGRPMGEQAPGWPRRQTASSRAAGPVRRPSWFPERACPWGTLLSTRTGVHYRL